MFNVTDRFIAASGGNFARNDLYVCDVQRIDHEKCAALIAHDPALASPKVDDVYGWVKATFNGALVPQMSTFKVHPYEKCVSVVLTANALTRPESDKSTMRAVTATLFSEDRTASMWALVTSGDGRKYLVRNREEDVGDIVARVQRRNPHNADAKLASVKLAAPACDVGDHVKFFGPRNESLYGEVTNCSGEYVTIKTPHDGQSHTVSKYSVSEVTQKGPDAQARERAKLEEFFAVAYGSREFAQQFTQRGVNDTGIRNDVPSFSK